MKRPQQSLRSCLFVLALCASTVAASARADGMIGTAYDVTYPVGSFHRNFSDRVSFRGMHIHGRWFLWGHRLSVGVEFGWSNFRDFVPRRTYPITNGAVTATLRNYADVYTLWPTAHVYLLTRGYVRPYAGLGIGVAAISYQVVASDLGTSKSDWYFAMKPEIGALFYFNSDEFFGLFTNLTYTFTTGAFLDVTNTAFVGVELGAFTQF